MKTKIFIMLALCLIGTACNDKEPNSEQEYPKNITLKSKWECILEQYGIIITLTVDSTTNLVSVGKSPEEMGENDGYHQFRNEDQYFLQNDTLYYLEDNEMPDKENEFFAITRISENKIKLKYLGFLPDFHLYMRNYLFNRIKME